ncbi:protein of unknown function [Taphrina deformans PYCC 5710]|uniref:Homologous-pairing protein 2 winged helix domain-containing protein n=1 Tax=Taphrina deformans (strain PYCC 5710 / ATCC 11124 / CBS 356.35 / IMI 108563 / JCM 9778 / NBRC 8474) TaxID=1097556 RepID=R4XE93_TAPDE|nr:protein of unknown function [Taphrina deformans PYCC 5710]|eukprot:CCG83992.1 protein of unknown function [Taphrina deformans PYCC 5710]
MAPKVKKDKLTDEVIQEICLEYMIAQNRPYNATDVALNCHEQFSKAAAQKALQVLADRELITCKNLAKDGKGSTLSQAEPLDAEGLAKLTAELEALRREVATIKEKNKSLAIGRVPQILVLEKNEIAH